MSEHLICRIALKGARADYHKKFKKHVKLSVSRFKISPTYCDYEVRLNNGESFNKVVDTSRCCAYDCKTKAIYTLIAEAEDQNEN